MDDFTQWIYRRCQESAKGNSRDRIRKRSNSLYPRFLESNKCIQTDFICRSALGESADALMLHMPLGSGGKIKNVVWDNFRKRKRT
jgi:hypothetical protein